MHEFIVQALPFSKASPSRVSTALLVPGDSEIKPDPWGGGTGDIHPILGV